MKPKNVLQMFVRRLGLRVPFHLLNSATRDMRALANTMSATDVVLDLGAHVGDATTEFAKVAKHVHAFEPNPHIYKTLTRQTQRYDNVTLYNKAISDRSETLDLFFEDTDPGHYFEGATIMQNKSNISYEKKVPIEALDIGEFIESLAEPITHIKMDIEGAEYRVLNRLLQSNYLDTVTQVYVECHVDRMPELAQEKSATLLEAEKLGYLDKLNFDWQ